MPLYSMKREERSEKSGRREAREDRSGRRKGPKTGGEKSKKREERSGRIALLGHRREREKWTIGPP